MRIVITTTLNNNLFHAKLTPLMQSCPDIELVVVSDRAGNNYERVTWVYPKGKITIFGRLFSRFLLLLKEAFHKDTKLIMAYSLVPHGLFAVIAAKLRRVPVFLHFIAGPAELHFAHDLRVTDNRIIENTRWPKMWEKIAHFFTLRADRVFVPGSVTQQSLLNDGVKQERISILHSTADLDKYRLPREDEIRDIDVIVCAQLRERKRPLFTLDVLAKLIKKHPNLKACWLGDGVMHDEFERGIEERGLRNNLQWLETDNVADFFKRSKLFLLCSVNEGLSLASLESMACGVVPIVARCGDMEFAIQTGHNGVILEQDAQIDDYVLAVQRLLEDEQARIKLSETARNEIVSQHSFASAEQKWRDILAQISPIKT
ncbi:glycosyltransferase [Aliiglaciecola lipolytica]|uniref:Poly(Glycerol-phosphate) alpha-glucosyltransferase n=1 Tax=Aliiglaciecola lipolytica E3 TaxID=1127673 RepID=K6WZ15_9ALTE|nr:glycosyltransferase [Aliiglaciecola lipolytica]GAC13694.1 poly(glycerol-phosphate) alpha-glucosyltransferase [Aliiglaciecola lipolytica E3]